MKMLSALRGLSAVHWALVLGCPALLAGVVALGIAVAPSGYDDGPGRETENDGAATVETSEPPAPAGDIGG
ncbi:hypothetical protein [Blastococcus sp. TF02A-26]|uniref:hypothetical protein n=1 Tax=Blastococcus sp. TF02A-26 TaxID=2250577 RepID=UPI000DE8C527|nr:hypothetical protein [Blastococcus sp. TF02A-26]RBY84310.1 hypothetical protein DQ240_14365 [Blastococcus sp. TF02A-26]